MTIVTVCTGANCTGAGVHGCRRSHARAVGVESTPCSQDSLCTPQSTLLACLVAWSSDRRSPSPPRSPVRSLTSRAARSPAPGDGAYGGRSHHDRHRAADGTFTVTGPVRACRSPRPGSRRWRSRQASRNYRWCCDRRRSPIRWSSPPLAARSGCRAPRARLCVTAAELSNIGRGRARRRAAQYAGLQPVPPPVVARRQSRRRRASRCAACRDRARAARWCCPTACR